MMTMPLLLNCLLWFVVYPSLTGYLIGVRYPAEFTRPLAFRYLAGFWVMFGIFSLICIPYTLMEKTLTELKDLYVLIIHGLALVSLAVFGIRHRSKERILTSVQAVKEAASDRWEMIRSYTREDWILLILTAAIIAFQLYRKIRESTGIYSDDTTYISMANDILYTDRIYRVGFTTGKLIESVWDIPAGKKYLMVFWYIMEAFYSRILGIHPLVFARTLFPALHLLLGYITVFHVSGKLLGKNFEKKSKAALYFLLTVLIEYHEMEILQDQVWGKTIFYATFFFFLFYLVNCVSQEASATRYGALLFLVCEGGVGLTTMSLLLVSVTTAVQTILWSARRRKIVPLVAGGFVGLAVGWHALVYMTVKFPEITEKILALTWERFF